MKLNDFAISTLRDRYMTDRDVEPADVFFRSVRNLCNGEHLERMEYYIERQWFVPSTPALANGGTTRGSEIACFLPNFGDSREGLNNHYREVNWLSSNGGGVGGNWANIRSVGSKTSHGSQSNGIIPFLGIIDRAVLAFAQGGTRRASYAAYLNATHPEIQEFIDMRRPTGGDYNRKCLNLHHGVVFDDEFMQAVVDGGTVDLVDPNDKRLTKVVKARVIWEAVLEARAFQGEPYMMFSDNADRVPNPILRAFGIKLTQSNLCTEILSATTMPDGSPSTGVCCLGSLNVELFDEYRDQINAVVADCLHYLWLVLDNYVRTAGPGSEQAVENAKFYRDVGLGTVGFHSYLQKSGIPFDSLTAKFYNKMLYRAIRDAADLANTELLDVLPPCPASVEASKIDPTVGVCVFTHMLAIAPNASTAIFVDTSGGVEPYLGNAVTRKTASGTFLWKNKHLEAALEPLGMNTDEVWHSIQINNGSVQHLDIPQQVKDVFKTAYELNQMWIIDLAADRQEFLDHTQSVNLFLVPNTPRAVFNKWHIEAWKRGLPTLYYTRSLTKHKASVGVEVHQIQQDQSEDCIACAN